MDYRHLLGVRFGFGFGLGLGLGLGFGFGFGLGLGLGLRLEFHQTPKGVAGPSGPGVFPSRNLGRIMVGVGVGVGVRVGAGIKFGAGVEVRVIVLGFSQSR